MEIAAEAMNNYLIEGHILQCKKVPAEKVHPLLWKGAYNSKKAGLHIRPQRRSQIEKKRMIKSKKVSLLNSSTCAYVGRLTKINIKIGKNPRKRRENQKTSFRKRS